MKLIRFILLVLLCLPLSVAYMTEARAQFFMFENPMVDKPVPDFSAETLSSGKQRLSDFREGQSAIVFFWATWCPHCRTQLKNLNAQRKEFEANNIKVVLVDLAEPAQQVQSYMKKNKIGFEVFLDKDQSIAENFGVIGVPTFFFVNKDGIIKAVEHEIPSDYLQILGG